MDWVLFWQILLGVITLTLAVWALVLGFITVASAYPLDSTDPKG